MSPDQRLDAYDAQTGRADLTSAQMRRHLKKSRRELADDKKSAKREKPATP